MAKLTIVVTLAILCVVTSKPLESYENIMDAELSIAPAHSVQKRFINPALTSGAFDDSGFSKMRTKRSEDECEKLQLCKLHARSRQNFIAAFELYFVNRENARLWDHRARSMAECEQRFNCYDR
ncbi:uncharacterized protein LOC135075626 [Ostrinia nubilalis]|uniref:uncharacterized protein LOC114361573 n=1 Tax=Ostrinia furnacalis TaxID=93504 RepID=UPI00103DADA4|nr:uncharacterized protein LOC114361573 [Ostrinia furnacalis]